MQQHNHHHPPFTLTHSPSLISPLPIDSTLLPHHCCLMQEEPAQILWPSERQNGEGRGSIWDWQKEKKAYLEDSKQKPITSADNHHHPHSHPSPKLPLLPWVWRRHWWPPIPYKSQHRPCFPPFWWCQCSNINDELVHLCASPLHAPWSLQHQEALTSGCGVQEKEEKLPYKPLFVSHSIQGELTLSTPLKRIETQTMWEPCPIIGYN